MIKDFGFIIPQNCQFGMGALKKLPDFLKAAGSDNVMLISDRGLEAIGVVDKVREIIKGANLKYSEYLDVLPNPTTTIVDETVLLRYLLDDEPRPSAKARRLVASGCAQAYPETAARTVQLLEEDYHVPRSLIGTVMELLADDVSFQDGATVRLAARLYAGNRLPFASCLTAARNVLTGYPVETFNKQLSNIAR